MATLSLTEKLQKAQRELNFLLSNFSEFDKYHLMTPNFIIKDLFAGKVFVKIEGTDEYVLAEELPHNTLQNRLPEQMSVMIDLAEKAIHISNGEWLATEIAGAEKYNCYYLDINFDPITSTHITHDDLFTLKKVQDSSIPSKERGMANMFNGNILMHKHCHELEPQIDFTNSKWSSTLEARRQYLVDYIEDLQLKIQREQELAAMTPEEREAIFKKEQEEKERVIRAEKEKKAAATKAKNRLKEIKTLKEKECKHGKIYTWLTWLALTVFFIAMGDTFDYDWWVYVLIILGAILLAVLFIFALDVIVEDIVDAKYAKEEKTLSGEDDD